MDIGIWIDGLSQRFEPWVHISQLLGLFIALSVAVFLRSNLKAIPFRSVSQSINQIANQKQLAILLISLLAFFGSVAVSLAIFFPYPNTADEFCYLLMADTFAQGQLTNPTHPMWHHFETFHVIHEPTYMAKYPPAQGLLLAIGLVLGGHPLFGVWLGTALGCGAICWMLQGWLRPKWAFIGALLAVMQIGVASYWAQSYWGGMVAATGGALVFGSIRRLVQRSCALYSVLLAVGLLLLANSRPYEGFLIAVPAMVVLIACLFRGRRLNALDFFKRIVLPLGAIMCIGTMLMGYYNFRVTGTALRMPYQVANATYQAAPHFLWMEPNPTPTYRHKSLFDLHAKRELEDFKKQKTLRGFLEMAKLKILDLWQFYLGVILIIPLLALRHILKSKWMMFAFALWMGLLLELIFGQLYAYPHYMAPVTCLTFVLVVQGMRHLGLYRWRRRRVGKIIVSAIPIICFLSLCVVLVGRVVAPPYTCYFSRELARKSLAQEEGQHLVIVQYSEHHNYHQEWVYNSADIDSAKIVWSRDMGPERNRALFNYFKDRTLWLARPEEYIDAITSEGTTANNTPLLKRIYA